MKFKEGDKVVVKKNLEKLSTKYDITSTMKE